MRKRRRRRGRWRRRCPVRRCLPLSVSPCSYSASAVAVAARAVACEEVHRSIAAAKWQISHTRGFEHRRRGNVLKREEEEKE